MSTSSVYAIISQTHSDEEEVQSTRCISRRKVHRTLNTMLKRVDNAMFKKIPMTSFDIYKMKREAEELPTHYDPIIAPRIRRLLDDLEQLVV